MVLFPDLIQQLETISEKIADISANLFTGSIDDARRTFLFVVSLRHSFETALFNRRIVNERLHGEEQNFVDYCQYHIDMGKAHQLLTDAISLLGKLGSPRFVTTEHHLVSFFEQELRGVTNSDFKGDEAYYLQMFREHASPLLEQIEVVIERLVTLLGELQRIEKQKEVRLIFINKTPKYRSLCEKLPYKDHRDLLDYVENKIEDCLSRGDYTNDNVTKRTIAGSYQGALHAHIPMPLGNHRIIYTWDAKSRTLTYIAIGTHKGLGLT